MERIENIKVEHPYWGYRRIWTYLRHIEGLVIGKNRVYRIMKENNLLIKKANRNRAKRSSGRGKLRAKKPNEIWGRDMTKIKLESWGWLYLVVVLDWYTKEIIGYSLKLRSTKEDWLESLNMVVNNRFPEGIKEKAEKLFWVTDNQPTSMKCLEGCSNLGIKQIFTSWLNPKGNANTERVIRTIKEDLVWPREWENPFEFEEAFRKWIWEYNNLYLHQGLNYKMPKQCYDEYIIKTEVLV